MVITKSLPACGFLVMASKSGQVPLSVEKRAKGKKVTVVMGVQGNASALCATLTALLGVGGTTHPKGAGLADVEVQGEQLERVEGALVRLGCVRGLAPARETAATVVQRDYAYDSVLAGTTRQNRKAEPVIIPVPPEDAPCRSWHGHWLYCQGRCEQVDPAGIWLESARPARLAARRTSPAENVDAAALQTALRGLGMLAEPGPEIREWHARRTARDGEAERRRVDPTPSMSAPPRVPGLASKAAVALRCEECGATFSLRATLEKHRRQHRSDREAASRGQPAAGVADAEDVSWRGSTYEQSAAYEAEAELEGWGDEAGDAGSDSEHKAPTHTFSLDAFVSRGSKQSFSGKRRQTRGRGSGAGASAAAPAATLGKGFSSACPICNVFFSQADIESHVDECLAFSQAVSDSRDDVLDCLPVCDASKPRSPEDDVLSADLLESLLELELSAEATSRFWQYFDQANQAPRAIAAESFLNALSRVLLDVVEQPASSTGDVEAKGSSGCEVRSSWRSSRAKKAAPALSSPCPLCGVMLAEDCIEHHVEECLQKCSASGAKLASEDAPPKESAQVAEDSSSHIASEDGIVQSQGPLLANDVVAWLRTELILLIGESDAEGLIACVEVILEDGDAEAIANARDIIASELPASERSNAVLVQFCDLVARVSCV